MTFARQFYRFSEAPDLQRFVNTDFAKKDPCLNCSLRLGLFAQLCHIASDIAAVPRGCAHCCMGQTLLLIQAECESSLRLGASYLSRRQIVHAL